MNKAQWKALEYARDGMFVPQELTREIISKVQINRHSKIAVLVSYEMLPVLQDLGYKEVTLVTDNKKPFLRTICDEYDYNIVSVEEYKSMKFDTILGNPPFQKTKKNGDRMDQASNLWSDFWSSSIKNSTDDGKIALITPTSWASPSADLRGESVVDGESRLWHIFDRHTSVAKIEGVGDHFPGVGSSFGYVIVDKSGSDGLSFQEGYDTRLGFLPKSNIDVCVREMGGKTTLANKFKVDQSNSPLHRVSIPLTRKVERSSVEILSADDCGPISGSPKPELYLYVYCNTKKECNLVRSRILECAEILNSYCRWSGFMNIQTLKMINYVE